MPANRIKIDNSVLKRNKYKKKKNKKRQIVYRILIVSEGTKTEPNYFKKFRRINRGTIIYEIEVEGTALNTLGVVEKAIDLKNKASIPYDRVWAVFDKDDFSDNDFNSAIKKAEKKGISCAWSNEAFELWYLLHFQYRNTGMNRTEYKKEISKEVNNSLKYTKNTRYKYKKNDPNNYDIMNEYGSQEDAIKNAEKLCGIYTNKKFATHNPCTTVHKLVLQLIGKDEKLISDVEKEMYK